MRAILIDPRLHRVTDLELPDKEADQLPEMRRLIGSKNLDYMRISDLGDFLWCDGAGLQQTVCWAFKLRDGGPFAGKCIIIGTAPDGGAMPPIVPVAMIQNDIDWLGEIEPEIHWEESPIALPNGVMIQRVRSFVTYKRVRR